MRSSAGVDRRLSYRWAGSTSPSRAAPSRPPSHLSSAVTCSLRDRGITVPNDRRAARSRRVATRIWCTASGASARTSGSSEVRASTWIRRYASTTSPADDERRGWVPATGACCCPAAGTLSDRGDCGGRAELGDFGDRSGRDVSLFTFRRVSVSVMFTAAITTRYPARSIPFICAGRGLLVLFEPRHQRA